MLFSKCGCGEHVEITLDCTTYEHILSAGTDGPGQTECFKTEKCILGYFGHAVRTDTRHLGKNVISSKSE